MTIDGNNPSHYWVLVKNSIPTRWFCRVCLVNGYFDDDSRRVKSDPIFCDPDLRVVYKVMET